MQAAAKLMDAGNYSHIHVERAFLATRGKTAGSMNTKLLAWDRVACTLTKSIISETGIIHPDRLRYLSIAEARRIGSFPDGFIFVGDFKQQWARIGNSVPPLLMASIAGHVRGLL